jgi:hypothetical protein
MRSAAELLTHSVRSFLHCQTVCPNTTHNTDSYAIMVRTCANHTLQQRQKVQPSVHQPYVLVRHVLPCWHMYKNSTSQNMESTPSAKQLSCSKRKLSPTATCVPRRRLT